MTGRTVDLSDNTAFGAGFPHESFNWLRTNDPVHWHEPTPKSPDGEGFWVVSRYDDVMEIFRTPEVFSSNTGGARTGGGTTMKDERAAGKVLNYTDDPQHRTLRQLVNKGFTARALNLLERNLQERANTLIDAFPEGESFDFVQAFARELPLHAICMILGVPQADRTQLCDWIEEGIAADSPNVMAVEYLRKVKEYALGLIAEKRRRPEDDILSTIVHARLSEEGDRQLSEEELVNFFILLFPAGAETTRNSFGAGLRTLCEHPDQLARLRREPGLVRSAIEEIVRWTTPSIYKRRTVTRDTEFRGRSLKTGDKVTVWEMSANRDDRVFDSPFTFDIARTPNKHIGFGFGPHICLGAALARLELKIGLEALLSRIAAFEIEGPPEWVPNNRLLGLKRLPLRITFKGH
jgi:cytochrome P450